MSRSFTGRLAVGSLSLAFIAVGAFAASAPSTDAGDASAEQLRAELLAKMAEINDKQRNLLEQMDAVDKQRRELELLVARVSNLENYRAGQAPTTAQPGEVAAERKAEKDAQDEKLPELPRISSELGGVLTPKGRLVLEPSIQYVYSSARRVSIEGITFPGGLIGAVDVREADREAVIGAVTARYGITPRLETELRLPYVYRHDSTRTRRVLETDINESTFTGQGDGIGDMELDLRYQLPRRSLNWPFLVANVRTRIPTGTDPFELQAKANAAGQAESEELATGSGFWSFNPSMTFMYPSDPVVFFGNLGYLWTVEDDKGSDMGKVDPGDSVRMNFGMGFGLNDRSSFSLSYSLDLFSSTKIELRDETTSAILRQTIPGSDVTVGKLIIGYSLRTPGGMPLNLSIGIGATEDAPDTEITFRIPFTVFDPPSH